MPAQIIPLTSSPRQNFSVSVNIDGGIQTFRVDLRFSYMAQYWVLSIADENGNALVSSLACVTADWPAANVLSQFAHLKIGSIFFVNASSIPADYPGVSNLGTDFVMIWDDTPSQATGTLVVT